MESPWRLEIFSFHRQLLVKRATWGVTKNVKLAMLGPLVNCIPVLHRLSYSYSATGKTVNT